MSINQVIDDITEYDAIYRSDGPDYVKLRKYFLQKNSKTLNQKFRENNYLPIRILLLETTRSRAKHSLNDLWMLLHTRRMKEPVIQSISMEDIEMIPWHQMSTAITAPGPVSTLRCAPKSRDHFAFSTFDGSLYFAVLNTLQRKIVSHVSLPDISFFKFDWVTDSLIIGIGVTSSVFAISSDSHIFEIPLKAPPSEILRYPCQEGHLALVGDRSGQVLALGLTELVSNVKQTDILFKQPTSATISKADIDISRIHNIKRPVTSLACSQNGDVIVVGTTDGDVDVITIEQKIIKKKKRLIVELKARGTIKLDVSRLTAGIKGISIDALSIVNTQEDFYIFANARNENAGLFMSPDALKHIQLVKQFRIPSLRAKCPGQMNMVNNRWLWACGTDMGDLILCEEGDDPTILTLHENPIASLEWMEDSKVFMAADQSGLISIWTKSE